MTTPSELFGGPAEVEHRLEHSFEVDCTPAQAWHAVATSEGNAGWFLPAEIEERAGGTIRVSLDEDEYSEGTITDWVPPRLFAYEEPGFAPDAPGAAAPKVATEFLIEEREGGGCTMSIVTSAVGLGEEWEEEWFADMADSLMPFFAQLEIYLTHFAGQAATTFSVDAEFEGIEVEHIGPALLAGLGVNEERDRVEVAGVIGVVEQLDDTDAVLIRTTSPVPGLLSFTVWGHDDHGHISLAGYLYDTDQEKVDQQTQAWQDWLGEMAVPASS